jgi:hypothetical protein
VFSQSEMLLICSSGRKSEAISFARKTDISRPTLDKLLNGSIDSKSTFDRHLQKILKILNILVDELILYHPVSAKTVTTVYSQNVPVDHEMSDKAKKQYDLLLDVIDLCTIYY